MKVSSWQMWNQVWCYSRLLPPGTVTDLGIKPINRKCVGKRKGKGGKSPLGFSYHWEEQSWVQSQWGRERRMAQQDPWSAAKRLPPCAWLTSLLCVTLLICADSMFRRPRLGFCNTRHKGPLNRYCNNMKQKLQPSDRKNKALPVSNFAPGEAPCHMKLWATAASVISTKKEDGSWVYF